MSTRGAARDPLPKDAPGLEAAIAQDVLTWFAQHARKLPWRAPDRTAWGVLVSEFMLQQTQVDRVLPIWTSWMHRWPTPADLAQAPADEVLRHWGRLGYPRRARWLQQAAAVITGSHAGRVPDDMQALRELPGIGEYTAAAVCAFAYGQPTVVLDTNIRRVLIRVDAAKALPSAHVTNVERATATRFVAAAGQSGAVWSAAVMELGALVCRARRPVCEACPIAAACRWRQEGFPGELAPQRRQAAYAGSDRQARGAILDRLRTASDPIAIEHLASVWPDDAQRERAVTSLLADGLVHAVAGHLRLGDGTSPPC